MLLESREVEEPRVGVQNHSDRWTYGEMIKGEEVNTSGTRSLLFEKRGNEFGGERPGCKSEKYPQERRMKLLFVVTTDLVS